MEPDSEQTTLVDNVSVAGTVENESDENGSRSQVSTLPSSFRNLTPVVGLYCSNWIFGNRSRCR